VTGSNSSRRTGLVCLLLALVTLALYWPARHYDFVQYDDNDYVFDNPTVRNGLSWWGLAWSLVAAHAANWHPLTWLSHMLDCQCFGLNAGPHHLVSVFLHCANAVLLFLVLRSMTCLRHAGPPRSDATEREHNWQRDSAARAASATQAGAFWRSAFVAAVFAWHPLRVESVAWISERKDVLSGFFFMLTLWAYARYVSSVECRVSSAIDAPSPVTCHPSRFWRLALLFFALGLLCKPMLVTAPFVLLLLDFWPLNRFQAARVGVGRPSTAASLFGIPRNLLVEKLPFFFLSAAVSLIAFYAQKAGGAVNADPPAGIFSRIENALVGYVGYLDKLFWPRDLAVLYLRPPTVPAVPVIFAVLILAGISAVAGANLRRRPCLAVGWLWFLGMLLPVSGLIPVGLQSIADRYTYLPAIGLSLMVAWGVPEMAPALFTNQTWRLAAGVAAAFVLLACVVLTHRQLACWKDTETLMEHALEIDPNNYVAHSNLGVHFSRLGRTREAQFHYQRARELDPALASSSNK